LANGAETEIFCPPRAYPRGYKVTVTGASVASAPDERVLRLVHDGRAPDVTVKIEPRG
jgi:hypothetical protein